MRVRTKILFIRKFWPVIVSAASAMVMILAFFIPSVQDQWDRYQSRKVIEQYVQLGDDFYKEENYKMSVEAYAKAYELSENKRLDIEVKRLDAKVNLIFLNSEWGRKPPTDLEEVDFQFLLHMQKGKGLEKQRANTLTCFATYLSGLGRVKEADDNFKKAIALNPEEDITYVNYGNLLDQEGKKDEAVKAYLKAISVNSKNVEAHYNLGLLYVDQGKLKEAEFELSQAVLLDPTDKESVKQHELILEQLKSE